MGTMFRGPQNFGKLLEAREGLGKSQLTQSARQIRIVGRDIMRQVFPITGPHIVAFGKLHPPYNGVRLLPDILMHSLRLAVARAGYDRRERFIKRLPERAVDGGPLEEVFRRRRRRHRRRGIFYVTRFIVRHIVHLKKIVIDETDDDGRSGKSGASAAL